MSVTISNFYRFSLIFWSYIIAILLQFLKITYWRSTFQSHSKPSTEKVDKLKYYNMEAFVEEEQKRVQRKARELAKVDQLHRLLVQQQLQDLQRRRILRLAMARRRLEYSN